MYSTTSPSDPQVNPNTEGHSPHLARSVPLIDGDSNKARNELPRNPTPAGDAGGGVASPSKSSLTTQSDHIGHTFDLFKDDNGVLEVRAFVNERGWDNVYSGYFDDRDAFIDAVEKVSKRKECNAVYVTLNLANPALLARRANRLEKDTKRGSNTSDKDIVSRRYILIDLDPERPSGISSTKAELDKAIELGKEIRAFLYDYGFPVFQSAISGNGVHFLPAVDMPNDEYHTNLVKDFLNALNDKFGNDVVKIDTSVFNAARITKVYGSMVRKGENMDDRPHRLSMFGNEIVSREVVPTALIQKFVDEFGNNQPVKPTKKKQSTSDVDARQWLEDWVIQFGIDGKWSGNVYELDKCHFSDAHSDGAKLGVLTGGGIWAKCHHDSCQGKDWKEFRDIYDPKPDVTGLPKTSNGNSGSNGSAQKTGQYVDGRFDYKDEDGGILDEWDRRQGNEWLFAAGWEKWMQWSITHWERDESHANSRAIERLIDELNDDARAELDGVRAALRVTPADDDKEKDRLKFLMKQIGSYITATKRTKTRILSVASMASHRKAVSATQFDNGNVLNLANGCLNLDTFELTPHSQNNYFTYCLPYEYNPDATCANFERYLATAIVEKDGDQWRSDMETIMLLQELIGYSLTIDTTLEIMAWLYGEGGTGKSTLLFVLYTLLGPLAQNVNFQTLASPGNYDLVNVMGKRIVFSSESQRNGAVVESIIKQMVSGEPITARAIREAPITFEPVATIWWAMNEKPRITGTDDSMWRRMKVIPFLRKFEGSSKDEKLKDKLADEMPGILNFALDGLRRLRQQGKFTESSAVQKATKEYKHESNTILLWFNDFVDTYDQYEGQKEWFTFDMLYYSFKQWCERNNHGAFSGTKFGTTIKELGISIESKRQSGSIGIVGPDSKKKTSHLIKVESADI